MIPVVSRQQKCFLSRVGIVLLIATSSFLLVNCGKSDAAAKGSEASADAEDPLLSDKCYAPTREVAVWEKDQWVKQLAEVAKEAEKTSGVPAAAIVAMSARESGFGTTRLYLGAFNPYAYKWNASSAEGKPKWVLTCQPKADPGNEYVKFNNYWDATLFLGRKLGSGERYKAATDQYVKDRQSGVKVDTAVDSWVARIAVAGYNYDPPAYQGDIIKIMYNYRVPSWSRSNDYNLYGISQAVTPRSQ